MSPLPYPIPNPAPMAAGSVGLRGVQKRDAQALQHLLTVNRSWLERWEATYPSGAGIVPGSVSMKPMVRALQRLQRSGASVSFVITWDEEVVGQLSVADISGGALRSASIGYWVSETHAGRGITPTAVALAIDYSMQILNMHRIEICIRPENHASLRVVEKLGLRYEGRRLSYIHINGQWCDHESFAVTREEIPEGMLTRLGAAPQLERRETIQ